MELSHLIDLVEVKIARVTLVHLNDLFLDRLGHLHNLIILFLCHFMAAHVLLAHFLVSHALCDDVVKLDPEQSYSVHELHLLDHESDRGIARLLLLLFFLLCK